MQYPLHQCHARSALQICSIATRFPVSGASQLTGAQIRVVFASKSPYSSTSNQGLSSSPRVETNTTELDLLNPPPTTRPPPLDLPARSQETSTFKHLLATGKAYLKFYKTGLKAVLTNYRLAKALCSPPSPPAAAALSSHFPSSSTSPHRPPVPLRVPIFWTRGLPLPPPATWTRAQWVLYRRARHDVLRLPLFGLMLLVFDEFTPLLVLAFTGIVPLTCRIPRQVNELEIAAEARRAGMMKALEVDARVAAAAAEAEAEAGQDKDGGAGVRGARRKQTDRDALASVQAALARQEAERASGSSVNTLLVGPTKARTHALRALGIVSGRWDVLGLWRAPPGAWWLKGESRMAFLAGDDELLRRGGVPLCQPRDPEKDQEEGAVSSVLAPLSDPELRLACFERSIPVLRRDPDQLRADLARWLYLTAGKDWVERRKRITVLLMTRRENWPERRDFALPEGWHL